jgi:hypothetical protein
MKINSTKIKFSYYINQEIILKYLDYDNIPKRDIEMYSVSVWLNEQKK